MTVALTKDTLNQLAKIFGLNSSKYNALVSAAANSSFLAGELNAFNVLAGWEFKAGVAGSGVFADPTNKVVNLDSSWNETGNPFATTIAHELGHALLVGGIQTVGSATLADAVGNGHMNEGVALVAEYIVATQLGMTDGAAGYMHSDSDHVLTPQLNTLARGIDITGMLYGSIAANAFANPKSGAVVAAGNYNGLKHPSTAPLLTYDEYNAAWFIVGNSGIDPNRIDWTHVEPRAVKYTSALVNGQVVYTVDMKLVPLLDGKSMSITGDISPKGMTDAIILGSNGAQFEEVKTNEQGILLQKIIYDSNGGKAQQYEFSLDSSYTKYVFGLDGSQTATLFGVNGQMTESVKFNASGFKTQDILYGLNGKPTQQYDFNFDKSYTRYDFSADGSQTATLYGISGQAKEYIKFNATGYKTQDIFYGTNGKMTQQFDFNLDKSYASHVFNADGSQIAALFGVSGQMTQYTTYNASLFKTQDLFYGTNGILTRQVDFNLDKSYTAHVFNADGSQIAALFGVSGQMTQYSTYNASLYKIQDLFYGSNNTLTKQIDFNLDHSYAWHVFNADGSQIAALFGVNGQMIQYTTYNASLYKTQDILYGLNGSVAKQFDFNLDHSYTSHVYSPDGSQVAALFNISGIMTERATFNSNNFMTQDLQFSSAGALVKQYDFKLDHSYMLYNFATNGSQTVSLYGTNGQMTEYVTYNAKQFMTQDILYAPNGNKARQYDINMDSSYSSHVFYDDGSQVAALFGVDGKMSQYSFFNPNNVRLQDITYNSKGDKTRQVDFHLDKSYDVHTLNGDGSQIATLYGINGKISENVTYNSSLQKTQDIFYDINGSKSKGYDFYIDNSYSAHVFNGNIEKVGSYNAAGIINGYAEYQGNWKKNSSFFNKYGQEIESDRFDISGNLTGFNQFTYNSNGTYTSRNYDSVGHKIGESLYSGDGLLVSNGVVYMSGGGGGMKIPAGGGNLYMSFQI